MQHPIEELCYEHAALMRLKLEETLGTFNGFFSSLCSLIKKYKDQLLAISALKVFYNLTNTPTIQIMLLEWSHFIFATHIQISANVLGYIHS